LPTAIRPVPRHHAHCGARLDYAEGWPAITDIDGEVRFEGR